MMNPCSDPEEQKILKLNECLLAADRIREAGRSERQGFGKLGCSKQNPNGGGASTSPKSSSWDIASAKNLFALLVQGSGSIPTESSSPLPRSSRFGEKSLVDQAPATSATPKEPTK
jgi:hypothetical protein